MQLSILRMFRAPSFCSQLQKILSLFFPLFATWVSFQDFCPTLLPWTPENTENDFSSTHRFVGREGSYWVLATLLFIQSLLFHLIQWEWRNIRVTYKLGSLGYSFSSLLIETWHISDPSPLLGRFYLALISARLEMAFDPL